MNTKQKLCVWLGIGVFVLMGLFPPWVYRLDAKDTRVEKSAGYSLLVSPPEAAPYPSWGWGEDLTTVKIDVARLLIQWAMLVAVVGGLLVTLGERRL